MLDPEKFPEYYCAAAYMMSDLFIDDNITERNWTNDENDISESELFKDTLSFEKEKESVTFACVDIKTLVQSQQHRFHKNLDVPRLGPIHCRFLNELFLTFALRSNAIYRQTQASTTSNEKEQTSDEIDQKSTVIVPLPYQTTRNSTKILIDSKNRLTCDQRLKAIILHKAASAYFCLVDRCEQDRNYGSCLRYLRLALNCYSAEFKLQSMQSNNNNIK
ncbi:unnamed protein product, partial [Rotaria sp. Silwood1]